MSTDPSALHQSTGKPSLPHSRAIPDHVKPAEVDLHDAWPTSSITMQRAGRHDREREHQPTYRHNLLDNAAPPLALPDPRWNSLRSSASLPCHRRTLLL